MSQHLRLATSRLRHACALVSPLTWLLLMTACGGTQPIAIEHDAHEEVHATGLRLSLLPRATPNLVRLSLWIDAGTRDADPPQLASVSAWGAARAAGDDVHARALPDAIELWIETSSDDVEHAIAKLANALSRRTVDADVVQAMVALLGNERSRRALDARVIAEQLALDAALGPDVAASLSPLGIADDDDAVTVSAIETFFADHFGPNRALLVSAGDARASQISAAMSRHLSRLPAARASRAERVLQFEAHAPSARVARGTDSWSSAVIVGHAANTVERRLRAIAAAWSLQGVETQLSAVRGASIGIASAQTGDAVEAIGRAAALDAQRQTEATIDQALHVREDLASISERAGLRFCVSASASDSAVASDSASSSVVGFGATLADARRNGPEDDARAQARIEAATTEINALIDRAHRAPSFRGQVGNQVAHVVLGNGARIAVQHRATQTVGIAVRFFGGAGFEQRHTHGTSALLSVLSSQACEGLGAGALAGRLRSLGAELMPTLDAESFGLRVTVPAAQWNAGLDVALRCALRPLLNRRVLRDAQARMWSALQPTQAQGRRALIAELLASTQPGAIATWGTLQSALLDLDVLQRAHAQSAVGARIAVSIVGNVSVQDAVVATASRLSNLPAGAVPRTLESSHVIGAVDALPSASDTPSALIAFRISEAADPIAARVFSALLGQTLALNPAMQVTWLDAGAWSRGAWAAIAVNVPIEALEGLDAQVGAALQTLSSQAGRARFNQLLTHAQRLDAAQLAEPVHEADRRAQALVESVAHDPRSRQPSRTFDTFVRTRPSYMVSRGKAAARAASTAAERP